MKVVTKSGEVLYDKPSEKEGEFVVPDDWGELLKAGGVRYLWGEERQTDKGTVIATYAKVLSLEDPDFAERFWGIAHSEIGKAVFRGELPAQTLL